MIFNPHINWHRHPAAPPGSSREWKIHTAETISIDVQADFSRSRTLIMENCHLLQHRPFSEAYLDYPWELGRRPRRWWHWRCSIGSPYQATQGPDRWSTISFYILDERWRYASWFSKVTIAVRDRRKFVWSLRSVKGRRGCANRKPASQTLAIGLYRISTGRSSQWGNFCFRIWERWCLCAQRMAGPDDREFHEQRENGQIIWETADFSWRRNRCLGARCWAFTRSLWSRYQRALEQPNCQRSDCQTQTEARRMVWVVRVFLSI